MRGTHQVLEERKDQMMRVINEELFIAGWDHYDGEEVFGDMRVGHSIRLAREPDNKHDPNAIAVYWPDPHDEKEAAKLGYVPRTSDGALALLMDNGHAVFSTIVKREVSSNPWKRLAIKIEVVEYESRVKR